MMEDRKRIYVRREQIFVDDFFDGKTLDDVALEVHRMISHYEPMTLGQDQRVVFAVERRLDAVLDVYLEFWRWETDQEFSCCQKQERAAEEKRKQRSEARRAAKQEALAALKQKQESEEYAEYQRLRAKFGDL